MRVPRGRCWAGACSADGLGRSRQERWAEVRSCWRRNRGLHGAPPRRVPSPGRSIRPRVVGALALWTTGRRPYDGCTNTNTNTTTNTAGQRGRRCIGLDRGPHRTSLGGGTCCQDGVLSRMGLLGLPRLGPDGRAVQWVLGGGVLGRRARPKSAGTLGGGQVVLAAVVEERGASVGAEAQAQAEAALSGPGRGRGVSGRPGATNGGQHGPPVRTAPAARGLRWARAACWRCLTTSTAQVPGMPAERQRKVPVRGGRRRVGPLVSCRIVWSRGRGLGCALIG